MTMEERKVVYNFLLITNKILSYKQRKKKIPSRIWAAFTESQRGVEEWLMNV